MDKKKFIQITSGEIASITHEMFFDYTDEIIRKSNPLHGERSFVLCMQIPLHRITDSASNGSVFPVVTEHFSASSDHAFL